MPARRGPPLTLSWDSGSLGSDGDPEEGGEEREGRDMPRAPRWCSGHLIPGRRAWPDCSASKLQMLPGCPGCPGWRSGARPGLYRFLEKVVLEEASWSGRGSGWGIVHSGGYVIVTNTVLASKVTVLAPASRRYRWGRTEGLWCQLGCSKVSLRVSACPLVCGPCLAGGYHLQNRSCR